MNGDIYVLLYVVVVLLLYVIVLFPGFASFILCPSATSKKKQHFCLRGATPPGRASRRHPEVPGGQSGRLGRQGASLCLAAGEQGRSEEPPRIG